VRTAATLTCLALALASAAPLTIAAAVAADINGVHAAKRTAVTHAPTPRRVPLALRTLSRRSASVMASVPCWHECTAQCGWSFQACLKVAPQDICFADNNSCDLICLKQCRLRGGPLLDITDY